MEPKIPENTIPLVEVAQSQPVQKKLIPLNGKLITAVDPALIGLSNFRTVTNMRYGDGYPRQIPGMTKINSSVMDATYLKGRNIFQFRKRQPDSIESHVLVQAFNSGLTAAQVLVNSAAPPATGNFTATELWTDDTTAGVGHFSDAPDGNVAYCNGVETCIWGGNESRCARFLNFDPAGTFLYDYTDMITNTRTDEENIAVFETSSNDIDANTMLMLHLDNNITDSSPTTPHTITNNNATFSNTAGQYVFGYSGVFNGTTAYLTAPDNADFDLTGGIWTYDLRARFDAFTAVNPLYYQKTDLLKVSFTSGSEEPSVGDTLVGATSEATAIVDYVDLDTGTWASDAAGTIYMHTQTGTFQSEDLNISGGTANVMSIGANTADAGDNYMTIFVDTDGKVNVLVHECYGAGSDVISITCGEVLSVATYYHIEVSENGNAWYVFIDGVLKSITTDSSRAKNYIDVLNIGGGASNYLDGYLDEIRLTKGVCRHTNDFTPPAAAYSTATVVANVYVGSLRPLKGVKFYTATENTAAAAAGGFYWSGSTWVEMTLTDGTATTGGTITLGQTGSITFATTVGSAKQKFIDGVPLYYYWFTFTDIDAATTISYVTLDAPFQPLVDYWDGADRSIGAFYKYTTTYTDYSSNCFENTYDTLYADTYANLASLGAYSAGANCVIIGFFERMTAVNISVPSDRTNSTAATICAVDYWDGKEFVTVGTIVDGTSEAGVSLAKSGTISWNPPDPWNVFTKSLSNSTLQLYYYRFRWDKALDATTAIYFASGIPAQRQIRGYSFPLHSQGRLMLCSNTDGERNTVLIGAEGTAQVFNGEDTLEVDFGNSDAINAGCSVFAMYGNTLYNITLFFKDSEMWGLVYSDGNWRKYSISETTGCPAPMTLQTCILPPIEGEVETNRSVAIWVAADGVYKSDGRHPIKISWDIDDLFDQNSTTHINQSYLPSFSASINRNQMEYRMLVAVTTGTVTTLDVEYVYDLKRSKWYYVDRGTGKKIQCATNVIDGYGNNHEYGLIETGYMERLEYGTTFDGTSITSTLQTGDGPLAEKDMLLETTVQGMLLMMVSKATTTATVTTTHYTDTISTGTDYTMDPTSTQRVLTTATAANSVSGLLHSFKMTITTSDETCGFEPLMLGVFYSPVRDGNY